MKVERRIILSNAFNIGLILLVGFFAMQNLNLMLTKLRFVEIADDLNESFLEMRLSEKNYFLYRDETALYDLKEKIDNTLESIGQVKEDIIRAVGDDNLTLLLTYLKDYSGDVQDVRRDNSRDEALEARLRTSGKKLKEFSESITRLERTRVNEIISSSKRVLFYSFWAVVLSAVVISHLVSQKIVRSLRAIERLTKSISEGNFNKIEGIKPTDEFGSVITAVNSMSEELRNREDQIIQSKKLASIGVLTTGVAHELTNPLNNISMIAQTYQELYDKLGREERLELMNKVEGETERIREIVRSLLDFSKPKEANLQETSVNSVIEKTLKLVQNMIDVSNIETRLNLQGGLPPVFIDTHQIQQVLVNLIANAVQAMPGGGRLFIASRKGRNADSVEIAVMDTGKGIPPEYLSHVFDPFFSTKGEGGTGLGLSVSYGIVKHHKGDIRVESKVGVGTTFTIELPVARRVEVESLAKSA